MPRQYKTDGCEAGRCGINTNESTTGTSTRKPKGQPTVKQQAPVAAADEPPREKIYLSKESMAMVKEAVALGTLLPSSASRDELRAYNKLVGELTQQTIQWRLAIEKQEKADLEQKNSRRQHHRSDS